MGFIELACPKPGCNQTVISMSERRLAVMRLNHHIEHAHPDEADSLKERKHRRPVMSWE